MRGALVALAAILLVGCGSSGSSTVSKSWQRVDACLEKHSSFHGNVAAFDRGGGGGEGYLYLIDNPSSGGHLVNAYRFPSHSAAVAFERAVVPYNRSTSGNGSPVAVEYYGDIALEINAGVSSQDVAEIKRCFNQAYG